MESQEMSEQTAVEIPEPVNMESEVLEKATKEPEPVITHDGRGLDLEQVRNLVMQQNNEILGKDDPLLIMVTILNAFIGEQEKVNDRHHNALVRIMSESTDKYITGVKNSVDTLSNELSNASVGTIKEVMQQEDLSRVKYGQNMKWATLIVGVSALVNVVVFALGALK